MMAPERRLRAGRHAHRGELGDSQTRLARRWRCVTPQLSPGGPLPAMGIPVDMDNTHETHRQVMDHACPAAAVGWAGAISTMISVDRCLSGDTWTAPVGDS
jgi:hypothetical protein